MTKKSFPLLGMSCAACVGHATRALEGVPGVKEATVNLTTATAFVQYDPKQCTLEQMRDAVAEMGYELRIDEPEAEEVEALKRSTEKSLQRQALVAVVLSAIVMALMMIPPMTGTKSLIAGVLTTIVLLYAGRGFYARGYKQLRTRSAGMDLLVMLSTAVAYLYSLYHLVEYFVDSQVMHHLHHLYFEAASMTIAFVLLGKVLEARAQRQTSTALRALMGAQPKTVSYPLPGGELGQMPITEVEPGMTLVALPHELLAVDGTVLSGESYVDEQLLSGEPIPVAKTEGAEVYAGTLNGSGTLYYRASQVGRATLLSRIIRLVQEAQSSRAPIQAVVDKVASIFVPIVVTLALIAWVLWGLLLSDGGWSEGLVSAVTVLIIACPCALGLATPTALMVGIGRGAKEGILIRRAQGLEAARHIDTIVMDKTGTITQGKPRLQSIRWTSARGEGDEAILSLLEQHSTHPLAEAVVTALSEELKGKSQTTELSAFTEVAGAGLQGVIAGTTYYVGNVNYVTSQGLVITDEVAALLEEGREAGATISLFASERAILALLLLSDELRPTSREAIDGLRRRGLEVIMLTGDGETAAAAVAAEMGDIRYEHSMRPEGKADYVESLQKAGRHVAMVGDGINDAAALARADLSLAMGSGSDLAMETAEVTLRTSDLRAIPTFFDLSRHTLRRIHQNLFWASIYNLLAIPVAAGILYPFIGYRLDPMLAGGLMMLSSLSVVLNSLRR